MPRTLSAARMLEVEGSGPAPIVGDPSPGALSALLHFVYDALLLAAVLLASPWWLVKAARDRGFRRMVRERCTAGLPLRPPASGRRLLVHGVSVGEVKSASPFVRALRERWPDLEVTVSTTTNTGLEVARRTFPDLQVVRFPLDLSFLVRRFLRRLRPSAIVLVELEIWPNFLRQCNRAGLPVAVVNGRITASSFSSYQLFRRLLPQFNRISLFCAQDPGYARRFLELSGEPGRVVVTGNMKSDGLEVGLVEAPRELGRLLGGRPGQAVVVAGSTHPEEERMVAAAWREGAPSARLVLVPRHPERAASIAADLAGRGPQPQRLTDLRAGREGPDPDRPALVDTIGELEAVYALADLVFVGGSLVPHGGQNVLEPAARGRPVLFGPHVENFRAETRLLEEAGAGRRVRDAEDLARAMRELLGDPGARERMAAAGMEAVRSQRGATGRTLDAVAAVVQARG